MGTFAVLISKVLNPLVLVWLTSFLVLTLQDLPPTQKASLLFLASLLAAAPVLILYSDFKKGKVASFWSPSKEERGKTLLFWVVAAFIAVLSAYAIEAPRLILALSLVLLVLGLLNALLVKFIKISVHSEMVTIFALTTILTLSVGFIYLISLIFLVGWARVYLKAHSLLEVVSGILLAILTVYTVFSFFGLATF